MGIEIDGIGGALATDYSSVNAVCNNEGVIINWKTAQESNSTKFDIERSDDNISWNVIGSINASGNSSTEKSYSYTDKNNNPNSLYRIVEYDITGRKTISQVINSSCNTKFIFSVYPNPVKEITDVLITAERPAPLDMKIYDSKGALIKKISATLNAGSNKIEVSLKGLVNGTYNLNAAWDNNVKTVKLMKVN